MKVMSASGSLLAVFTLLAKPIVLVLNDLAATSLIATGVVQSQVSAND